MVSTIFHIDHNGLEHSRLNIPPEKAEKPLIVSQKQVFLAGAIATATTKGWLAGYWSGISFPSFFASGPEG